MHKLLLAGLLPLLAEPVSQQMLVRLTTPIAGMAKAGARFEAVVTGCAQADCVAPLPPGSTIHGFVRETRPVRFGVRRERASMALEFDGCALPDSTPVACRTQLVTIDNARETVTSGNWIHGILAANHPHSYLHGLWMRPNSALLGRSVSGVSGAGRMLYRGISPHPLVGGAIIGARLALVRLPDPEIYFAPGTEMIVRVSGEAPEAVAPPGPAASPQLASWLTAAPVRVQMPDGSEAADIINLAFTGTAEELSAAFRDAGWLTADPMNRRTYAKSYGAFTSMHAYPTAPVSPLRYEGRLPDLVFQKSHNSMAKRHHIRLWKVEAPDADLWLGAATHDVGIVFDWKRMAMTHKIDRAIDRERDKVLADLTYASCVEHAARVERTALRSSGGRVTTDGALYVLDPRPCQSRPGGAVFERPKANLGKAIIRRAVLESRHYLLRGNGYYWAYRGLTSKALLGRFSKANAILAARQGRVGGAGRNRTDE